MNAQEADLRHPGDGFLRQDRMPHIWCPGCGVGTTVNCFIEAIQGSGLDLEKVCIVSGIGCTGRAAGYLNFDSFHTTHGRAIPFATGLKVADPELQVVVISGDGDLLSIGGNHIIHAARRNLDITVICVNNFNFGMTGGQGGPTTHSKAKTTTTPYGNPEPAFNVPMLLAGAGATYVARWTASHTRRLKKSMEEGLRRRGFSFIEVIASCPTNYGRRNKLGTALQEMCHYRDNSVVKNFPDLSELHSDMQGEIIVGTFVDTERPTFTDLLIRKV